MAVVTDDVVAWLREQLDEDEARTRKLLANAQQTALTLQDPRHLGKFIPGWHDWPDVEQMCTDRLREIEAKRRMINSECSFYPLGADIPVSRILKLLALPHAGRTGYREEWRP